MKQAWNKKSAIVTLGFALVCVSNYGAASTANKPNEASGTLVFESCSKPAWPQEMLAAKKTGTVTLAFLIGSDGKVKQSKVTRSSGHPELDEAARTGISKCTFRPGTIDGKPAEAWLQMQYVWSLG